MNGDINSVTVDRNATIENEPNAPESKAEIFAIRFHNTYERLAPAFGYKTKKEAGVHWSEVPTSHKQLMIAVCATVLIDMGRELY